MIAPRLAAAAAALLAMTTLTAPATAAERLALFPFDFVNSTLEPVQPAEEARLAMVRETAAAELAKRGYTLVDTAPAAAEAARYSSLHECNGCELDLARGLGAELAAVGWVQKVSNLILNVNLRVREVETGRVVHAGSVDIRGNTDESWRRGITSLINRRIFRDQPGNG